MNCRKGDLAYVSVPPADDYYELNGHFFTCLEYFCNAKTGKPMWKIDPMPSVLCPRCGVRHEIEGIADAVLRPVRPPPLEDDLPPVEITEPNEVFA